jgi:hypothetical protein
MLNTASERGLVYKPCFMGYCRAQSSHPAACGERSVFRQKHG